MTIEKARERIAQLEKERDALTELVGHAHAQVADLQKRLIAARAAVGVIG